MCQFTATSQANRLVNCVAVYTTRIWHESSTPPKPGLKRVSKTRRVVPTTLNCGDSGTTRKICQRHFSINPSTIAYRICLIDILLIILCRRCLVGKYFIKKRVHAQTLTYSAAPRGRKYCVPFTGCCKRRSNCCRSSLRSTKSISDVLITRRSEAE